MTNQLNMLFNQELCNESQYINSHPFSSINMSLGGEVRYIAPIWPWNAPKFQVVDWRLQPPPRRVPGNTKHDQGNLFQTPTTWGESTNATWNETQKPPPVFPFTRTMAPRDNLFSSKGDARMTEGAARLRTSQSASSNQSRAPTSDSDRPPANRMESRSGRGGGFTGGGGGDATMQINAGCQPLPTPSRLPIDSRYALHSAQLIRPRPLKFTATARCSMPLTQDAPLTRNTERCASRAARTCG